jgi:hypothetical protein
VDQRVTIEQGQAFDESHNRLDLDRPENSEIKAAVGSRTWDDGTYRLDKASRTLVRDDAGGGARSAI